MKPIHIQMRELELGEISKPGKTRIPVIHDDDVSGLRREPREKKSLYFYKLRYNLQSKNGSSTSYVTKTEERDIHIKCENGLSKEEIDKLAFNKLESSLMSDDRVLECAILFKKKIF